MIEGPYKIKNEELYKTKYEDPNKYKSEDYRSRNEDKYRSNYVRHIEKEKPLDPATSYQSRTEIR